MVAAFDALYLDLRPELTGYLRRLVVRLALAEELAQTTFQRWLEAGAEAPKERAHARAWLFRVATNLAIDELRRHSTWRETIMFDIRAACEADAGFMQTSAAMVGTPETKLIAREHLASCYACTIRNLAPRQSAAFWLTEVHDFKLAETAEMLGARPAQVKNWLQEARAYMRERYGSSCALIAKAGVCHQCTELADFFRSNEGDPLAGATDHIDARIRILRELRADPQGPWHTVVLGFIEQIFEE